MEFPEDANMNASRGEFMQPFGGFLDVIFIKFQKGGNEYMEEKRIFVGMIVIAFCIFVLTPIVSAGPIEESVQLTQAWVKAFNEGNAEALSALFARDAVYVSWASPYPAQGRDAIRATMAGFFQSFPIRYLMLRDENRKVYGDAVSLHNNFTLVYGDGKGPVKTIYGRNSAVNTIVEGRRLIIIQHNSFFPIAGP
jgi:uncharacterized protein (TIGR02246 family)